MLMRMLRMDRTYAQGLHAIYIASFQTPAILVNGGLLCLLSASLEAFPESYAVVMGGFIDWLLFAKVLELVSHLPPHPTHVHFVSASIIFGYLHGAINLYSLATLHVVSVF